MPTFEDVILHAIKAHQGQRDAELELKAKLSNVVKRYPVDIRILNNASLSFRYNVIKNGQPIVVNNDNIRSDFVEATLSTQLLNGAVSRSTSRGMALSGTGETRAMRFVSWDLREIWKMPLAAFKETSPHTIEPRSGHDRCPAPSTTTSY